MIIFSIFFFIERKLSPLSFKIDTTYLFFIKILNFTVDLNNSNKLKYKSKK